MVLRWPRCALRASLLTGLAPLTMALGLWITSGPLRPAAVVQLLPQLSLAQSFAVVPDRPLPELWRQRLPPGLALNLWRRSRGLWWQLWGTHAGSEAALLLPDDEELSDLPLSLKLGSHRLIAANALALEELQRRLDPSASVGEAVHCAALQQRAGSVLWRADALQAMAGPWSPLLLPLRQGCLSRAKQRWQGVVGSLARSRSRAGVARELPLAASLPPGVLLQLQGSALQPLVGGLLNQGPMQRALLQSYGVEAQLQRQVMGLPFLLQLRANPPQSLFKASLVLQLATTAAQADALEHVLERALGTSPSRGADGLIRGSWSRLESGQLVLVLGGELPEPLQPWKPLGQERAGLAELQLLARPVPLKVAGLLPPGMPAEIQRSALLRASWRGAASGEGPAQLEALLAP